VDSHVLQNHSICCFLCYTCHNHNHLVICVNSRPVRWNF
jgi:hypothetical protein